MTPNASRYHNAIKARFPFAVDGGIFSCRAIAGTRSWSQHAWANGDDIMTGPWNTATATSQARQKQIVAWLMEPVTTSSGYMRRYQAYGIRTILSWGRSVLTGSRVAGHYDHVHVDFWPYGIFTPPCRGGSLRVKYPNGTGGTFFRLYPNTRIIPKEEAVTVTYRTVRNVPADKSGRILPWAKDVIDWGIRTRLINVDDQHPDDWEEVLTSGRYWSFEYRQR